MIRPSRAGRSLRISAVLSVAVALMALSFPAHILACSCMPPPPPQEALERSAAVFAGTVVRLDTTGGQIGHVKATFDVDRDWKGRVAEGATVYTTASSAACGFGFVQGRSYLVYANESDGRLSTYLCSRTTGIENAREDIEAFETTDPQCGMPVGAVTVQMFAFLLGGLAIRRRYRIRRAS